MQTQLPLQQTLHMEPDQDDPAWLCSDEFRMYHFKISLCKKRFNHDWNFCCMAHTGERACRRDPLKYNYTSITCLDMLQKGKCPRGNACQAAHSVFEFWLHPHRYRTEMCKVGAGCNRRICFFAHRPEELRPLPEHLANTDGSAGGKYSLSAAPPGDKDSQQQQGNKPGELAQQQQKQRQQLAAAQAGSYMHGVGSSSSSRTSIVNLSNSIMGSTGGSDNNSPSAAASWLLTAGRDDAVTVFGANCFEGQTLRGVGAAAVSSSSPQQMYNTLLANLPPRMPQVGVGTHWAQQQQQQQVAAVGVGMQAGQQQLMAMQQPPQQLMAMHHSPQQQQQQNGLVVSNGLALQLQQLSLGADYGNAAAAGAVHVSAGFAAAGMQGQLFAPGGWQLQQQQQMVQIGMPMGQQQLLSAAPVSGGLVAVSAVAVDPHQQIYGQLQGQACMPGMLAATTAPQALCGVGLQQQQIGFIPGQVLADGSWHG